MKTFKLLFFTVLSLLNTNIFSQEQCGTDEILRRNPFLQQLYAERVDCTPEVPKLGLICGTDEYFKIGSIPLTVMDEIRDLSNINHVILDKQIMSIKYYTLRGVEVTYTRSLSNGIYLQETLFSDGTREVKKIFMGE